ncbi:heavy metal-associated isoprenylated plant protein 39-like [Wolffia australiana]
MGEKKLVLKLEVVDAKEKKKAMKTVTGLIGIDFVSMDLKEKKMTVVGMIDPVRVVSRLRKFWRTEVVSIGPAKEPEPKKEEKKEEPKKEEPKKEAAKEEKKEEPKKEEPKKEEEKKKEEPKEEKKEKDPNEQVAELVKMYRAYNPQMTVHYVVHSCEEDPTACVIC